MHLSLWSFKSKFNSYNYNMSLWLISNITIILFLALLLCSNPLTIGLTILSIALTIAIFYSLIYSSWFGLLIFIIYIRGILVIFSYFVALIPNQPLISISNLWVLTISFIIILTISKLIKSTSLIISTYSNFTEIIYKPYNTPILIFLAIVLLLIMVISVKITHRSSGPLRAFISYV